MHDRLPQLEHFNNYHLPSLILFSGNMQVETLIHSTENRDKSRHVKLSHFGLAVLTKNLEITSEYIVIVVYTI